jgi:hypothetical protein
MCLPEPGAPNSGPATRRPKRSPGSLSLAETGARQKSRASSYCCSCSCARVVWIDAKVTGKQVQSGTGPSEASTRWALQREACYQVVVNGPHDVDEGQHSNDPKAWDYYLGHRLGGPWDNRVMDDEDTTPTTGPVGSGEEPVESPSNGTKETPVPPMDTGDHLLALERARDQGNNESTRPPDDEAIIFRSMTVVEMYAGQAVAALTSALAKMEWINMDDPVVDRIREAQKGYLYSRGVFWIVGSSGQMRTLMGFGRAPLPTGIDRIYAEYYVLGPSLVALVLTFVLASDQTMSIDAVVRDDVESRLDRPGPQTISVKSVRDVKKERVRAARNEVEQKCHEWVSSTVPGTLSSVTEGLGPPTCALLSLKTARHLGLTAVTWR